MTTTPSEAAKEAHAIGNLLAVIHRDGGHYQSEHGTAKACDDAHDIIHALRTRLDAECGRRCASALETVARLPKYEDTGQHFVPGRDEAWTWCYPDKEPVRNLNDVADWGWNVNGWHAAWGGPQHDAIQDFYSTADAARLRVALAELARRDRIAEKGVAAD